MPKAKKDFITAPVEPSRLSRYNKVDGVWSQRLPASLWQVLDAAEGVGSFSPKNQNPSPQFGNSNGAALVDPLSNNDKAYIEDIVLTDGTALEAFMLVVKAVLGKRLQYMTETREYYPSERERRQAVEGIMTNQEYKSLISEIYKIDTDVKLRRHEAGALLQKQAFGRAAIGIKFKDGRPIELKPFSSRNLGQVYVNPNTWRLEGIGYHDNLIPRTNNQDRIFPASDILYFTSMDYNVKANTLYHGISKGKALIGASVAKRIILDEDLPESAKGQWAGTGIIKAPGITSQSKLNTLVNGMDPGKWNAINADIQLEVHKIADKLGELPLTVNELDRYEIRQIGVPIPLMPGYEDVTNRATIHEIVQVWKETRIAFERIELSEQVDVQWYETLMAEILQKPIAEIEYRVCQGYQDLIFDTTKDKLEALEKSRNIGLPISDEAAFEMLGWDNLIDEIQEVKKEMMKEESEQIKMRSELMGDDKNPAFEKKEE